MFESFRLQDINIDLPRLGKRHKYPYLVKDIIESQIRSYSPLFFSIIKACVKLTC